MLGILDVNGWHNLVHLAHRRCSDWAPLAAPSRRAPVRARPRHRLPRRGAWGFVIGSGEAILGIVPVNTEDNILHLPIAVLGHRRRARHAGDGAAPGTASAAPAPAPRSA